MREEDFGVQEEDRWDGRDGRRERCERLARVRLEAACSATRVFCASIRQ